MPIPTERDLLLAALAADGPDPVAAPLRKAASIRAPAGTDRTVPEPGEFLRRVRSLPDLLNEIGALPSLESSGPAAAVAAIPGVTARGLSQLLTKRIQHPGLRDAYEFIRSRYPRVLGHVTKINEGARGGYYGMSASEFKREALQRTPMEVFAADDVNGFRGIWDQLAAEKGAEGAKLAQKLSQHDINVSAHAGTDFYNLLNTAAEETAHAAQQIRYGQKFDELYATDAGRQMLEDNAKKAADRVVAKYRAWVAGQRRP